MYVGAMPLSLAHSGLQGELQPEHKNTKKENTELPVHFISSSRMYNITLPNNLYAFSARHIDAQGQVRIPLMLLSTLSRTNK